MAIDIPGLLSGLAGLPGAINQSLLGPMPVDPRLEQRMGPQVQQARQQALNNMAMGMLAGDIRGPGHTLARAAGNAQEGFSGRIFDLMKQSEYERFMSRQDESDAAEERLFSGLSQKERDLAKVAGPQWVAREEITAANTVPENTDPAAVKVYKFYVNQELAAGREPKSFEDWETKGGGAVASKHPVDYQKYLLTLSPGEKPSGQGFANFLANGSGRNVGDLLYDLMAKKLRGEQLTETEEQVRKDLLRMSVLDQLLQNRMP